MTNSELQFHPEKQIWQEYEGNPADGIIDMVRAGEISPAEAERLAQAHDDKELKKAETEGRSAFTIAPLARMADPIKFDPMKKAVWTIAETLVWIIWRNLKKVQLYSNEYRLASLHWVPYDPQRRTICGPGSWPAHTPHELRPYKVVSLLRLELQSNKEDTDNDIRKWTFADAKTDLLCKLRDDGAALRSSAITRGGDSAQLDYTDWRRLEFYQENAARRPSTLKYNDRLHIAADGAPELIYSDILFDRQDILRLWPEPLDYDHVATPVETVTITNGMVVNLFNEPGKRPAAKLAATTLSILEIWPDGIPNTVEASVRDKQIRDHALAKHKVRLSETVGNTTIKKALREAKAEFERRKNEAGHRAPNKAR